MNTLGEGEGGTNAESSVETDITMCKIRQPVGICCVTEETHIWCSETSSRRGMGWDVGGRFKREGTYV